MKFGRRLMEELMEPGWEAYYIQYYTLKKLIFQVVNAQDSEAEAILVRLFANRLQANIDAAEDFATSRLTAIKSEQASVQAAVASLKHASLDEDGGESADAALEGFAAWAEDVQSLLKFCITNRTAVRKITKKLCKNLETAQAKGDESPETQPQQQKQQQQRRLHLQSPLLRIMSRDPKALFEKVQEEVTDLVRVSKEIEYGLMVVCTEHVARVRASRAARLLEAEQLKLRRVERFERDLVQPFKLGRRRVPHVYVAWSSRRALAGALACPLVAVALRCGTPWLAQLSTRTASAADVGPELALWLCTVGQQVMVQVGLLCVALCVALQHTVVAAKLDSAAGRSAHWVSKWAVYTILLFASGGARTGDLLRLADASDVDVLLPLAGLHLGIETYLHARFRLCTRREMLAKLGCCVGLLGALWAHFAGLGEHALAGWLAPLSLLGYLATYAPGLGAAQVDIHVRPRQRRAKGLVY